MIIFCEECGERYIIEIEQIGGKVLEFMLVFVCKTCQYTIRTELQTSVRASTHESRGTEISDGIATAAGTIPSNKEG
ncbi:MAG: hypothetical protein ACE14T_03320 [Syntrophales bacterium]